MENETFRVRIGVRAYELDGLGHVNMSVYMNYAEHARWECTRAAGVDHDKLLASGFGPVNLETNIKYRRELRAGDEVDVSCGFVWGGGRTFEVVQEFRMPDGTVVAEMRSVGGVLDLTRRRLVSDPAGHFRDAAKTPEIMNL